MNLQFGKVLSTCSSLLCLSVSSTTFPILGLLETSQTFAFFSDESSGNRIRAVDGTDAPKIRNLGGGVLVLSGRLRGLNQLARQSLPPFHPACGGWSLCTPPGPTSTDTLVSPAAAPTSGCRIGGGGTT
jgi:hypothetical protein